jgi:hypothetical protein
LSLDLTRFSFEVNQEEPIAGGKMSTIPAEKIEYTRDNPKGRNRICAPPANHTCDGEEVCRFAVGDGT